MSDGDGSSWRARLPSLSRETAALLAVVLVLSAVGIAAAANLWGQTSGEVAVQDDSAPEAIVTCGCEVKLYGFGNDSSSTEVITGAGNATIGGPAAGSVTMDNIEGPWTRTSAINTSSGTISIDLADKYSVDVTGGVTAYDFRTTGGIAVDDGTTDFRYAANSEGTVTLTGLPASDEFEAITGTGKHIDQFTTDSNGHATITVPQSSETDVRIIDAADPVITDASPADDAQLEAANTTLSATVEDPDFATSEGDTVTVTIVLNGQQVKQTTISSNQTVSVDVEPPLGETSTWDVTVEDSYAQTDSIPQRSFEVPAQLKIYKETQPSQLVDGSNVNVTVRFFPTSEGGDVVTRTAKDGKVNLTGLPADEQFVVTADAENFTYRRIYIDSLYETTRIYLLNDSVDSSRVVFELQDPTGTFPPSETVLFVEKPIEVNNETKWQTIAGDTFGASSRFPSILRDGTRYRLRVRTLDSAQERILGFYSVYGNTVEPLKIQRIEPNANETQTGVVYGGLEGSGNDTNLAVRFRGGTNDTTVTYNVTNSTGAVIVPETSTTASSFAHLYPVAADGQFTVYWSIEYADGTTVSGEFGAGRIEGIADRLNIDPQVLSMMSWVAIFASMGLVVIWNRKLAPAVGTGMASTLVIFGFVAIPMPLLGISGAISVLTLFGGNQ